MMRKETPAMYSAAFLESLGLSLDAEENGGGGEEDSQSEVSDDSDMFHIEVLAVKDFMTEQDVDLELIADISSKLRARPLLPPDPKNAGKDYTDVHSGIAFPRYHCAFKYCGWTCDQACDGEEELKRHLRADHLEISDWDHEAFDWRDAFLQHREEDTGEKDLRLPGHVGHVFSLTILLPYDIEKSRECPSWV